MCYIPFIAFGLLICVSSLHHGLGAVNFMGPGWFPFWCSIVLIVLTAGLSRMDHKPCEQITLRGVRSIALIMGLFVAAYVVIKLLEHV